MARRVTDPVNGSIIFFINAYILVLNINVFHILSLLPRWFYCGREIRFISSNNLFSFIDFLYLNYIIQINGSTTIMWHGNWICLAVYSLEPCDRRSYFIALTITTTKALSVLRQQCSSIIGASTWWTVHI